MGNASASPEQYTTGTGHRQEGAFESISILAAADKLLSLPFDSMKRALESDKHVKGMSFAEELALMPAFSKDTATLPTVVKGVHTKVIKQALSSQESDPLLQHDSGQRVSASTPAVSSMLPSSVSASIPAQDFSPALPVRPNPQEIRESLPMQSHKSLVSSPPMQSHRGPVSSSNTAQHPREPPPGTGVQPFVENQYQQKSLPGKDKKLPHFGVGAHFELVGKHFVIRSLVQDGPAARSGKIAVGDLLVSIDNHGAGKDMFELSKKLLGLEGSSVFMVLRRPDEDNTYTVNIVRKNMNLHHQSAGVLGDVNGRNRRNNMVGRQLDRIGAVLRDTNSVIVL